MNTLYDQLKELMVIPDAYDKWQQYRQEVTRIILNECTGGSLLIIGAGACNDISIEELPSKFDSITLFDRDYDDGEAFLGRRLSGESNAKVVTGDLLGISDDSYRRLCFEVQDYIAMNMNKLSMSALADRYISLISDMYRAAEPDVSGLGDKYDYVVCLGVHSQINNMLAWMWDAYEHALGQGDTRVHDCIRKENDRIIKAVNDIIFGLAGRKVIIGAEQKRLGMDGGVEGAHQCILDIQKRICDYVYTDVNVTVLDWPFDFDRDIIYQMLISCISTN